MIIKNGTVLNGEFKLEKGDLFTEGDRIATSGDGEIIDATDCYVLPGLIDTHIHGCLDIHADDGNVGVIETMSRYLCEHGTTAFAPTTRTLALADIKKSLSAIDKEKGTVSGAKVAGVHLEGPFISREKRGALLERHILPCDTKTLDELLDCKGGDNVRLMTVAPELAGAEELIRHAVSRGIKISVGHSMATLATTNRAVEWGASQSTHTYNAMRPLNQREPGILGAVMTNDGIKCELICDFFHVAPATCEILIKLKGTDRINMISDCEWAAGLPDGEYHTSDGRVHYIKDGLLTLENGTIAGSTKMLLFGVQNLVKAGILSLEDAVKTASINPAKTLGIENETGSLSTGKKADIIILDKNLELLYTIVDGKIVYKA